MSNNRFRKGGVYTCKDCGKATRETGHSESGVRLCLRCYEIAGDENEVMDGYMTKGEFRAKWKRDPQV